MRTILWATAFVAGFAAIANAQSPMQGVGAVGAVDRTGKSFSTWRGAIGTYHTTPQTTFSVGSTPTSWAAVKAGHTVSVTYHVDGNKWIADQVVITE